MKRIFCLILALVMAAAPATAAFPAPPAGSVAISNRAELEAINLNLNGTYHLTADIDLSGTEWVPIGTFRGIFDGQGYTIRNLFVLESSRRPDAGLFSRTSGATIKNVAVHIGAEGVTSSSNSGTAAGGIVGLASSNTNILNCSVTGGSISAMSISISNSARVFAGGLIGRSNGSGNITIFNCHTTVDVYAVSPEAGAYAGGLIGYTSEIDIFACSSAGNISAKTSAGGLIGHWARGTARNSYATGNVSSQANAGGLFGHSRGIILNSYATGDVSATAVSGNSVAGGIAGRIRLAVSSYRLSTQTITGSTIVTNGTPLTEEQMRTRASFVGWNFDRIWDIDPAVNNGYPFIREDALFFNDDGAGIDYSDDDIIIPGSESGFSINLSKETITMPSAFTIVSFSTDGGAKWKAAKARTFDVAKFPKFFNKDLTLHLSDKPIERATKKPPEDSTVAFPKINKRPPVPKLVVNYLIGADNTGGSSGDWVLSAKGGSTAIKAGIQIGAPDWDKKERVVNSSGYGRFYEGSTVGIPVREAPRKAFKMAYFFRAEPKADGTVYTAASKAKRISVMSERKAPSYKVKKNIIKVKAGTSMVTMEGDVTSFSNKGEVNVKNHEGTIALWINATAKKPASARSFF
jgi:hypothetical protein